MNDKFDSWLEAEFKADFTRFSASVRPLAGVTSITRRKSMRFIPALPVALSAKAAAGLTFVALAAGGTAAVAVSDTTGHSSFGKSVGQKAQWCAQHLSQGAIGDCVSDFVLSHNPGKPNANADSSTHGNATNGSHPAPPTNAGNNPAGAPPANPSGAATSHTAPVVHPTGKP